MSIKSLFSTKKRIAAVALSGAVILGTGGIAAAYFTTSGSGTGSGATGSATALTITQTNTVTGLLPGGPAATIAYSVTNNTTGVQNVGAVTVTVTAVTSGSLVGTPTPEACAKSMYTTTAGTAPGTIAAGGTKTGTATISMTDDGNNQDNCQAANGGGALTLSFSAAA